MGVCGGGLYALTFFVDFVEAPEPDWRVRSRLVGRRLLPLVSTGVPCASAA